MQRRHQFSDGNNSKQTWCGILSLRKEWVSENDDRYEAMETMCHLSSDKS